MPDSPDKRLLSLSFNLEALDELGLSGKADIADLVILCYVYMQATAAKSRSEPTLRVKLSRELLAGFTPYAVLKESNASDGSSYGDSILKRLEDLNDSGILSIVVRDGPCYEVSPDAGFLEKCSALGVFSVWEKDTSPGNVSFGRYTVPAENILQQRQYSEAIRFIERYVAIDASLSGPSQLSAFLDFCAGIIQAETEANGMEAGRFSVYDPGAVKETRSIVNILFQSIKTISQLLDEGHHRLDTDHLRELLFEYVKSACGHYASLGIKKVSLLHLAAPEAAGAFERSIDDYSPVEGRRYFVNSALGLVSLRSCI